MKYSVHLPEWTNEGPAGRPFGRGVAVFVYMALVVFGCAYIERFQN